ncbi:TatD family hydrolase [Candidatus Gracilibacteria bacterium]|nr:TatD family hydrolase [Candidatus Gracilibacteria bacterium]
MSLEFIDSHCHIQLNEFDDDREAVIARALERGVNKMIIVGNDHQSNVDRFELLLSHPHCYQVIGIHPYHANEWNEVVQQWLEERLVLPQVIAVGEAGLDYFRPPTDKQVQQATLHAQIQLALQYNKPIVLHIRDAFDDTKAILSQYPGIRFVVHCFTGTVTDVSWICELGGYISLSGIVTFANATTLREASMTIPTDRLIIETDAPFLAPTPHRGQRCEPAFVADTAQYLAQLRNQDLESFATQIYQNTKKAFGFGGSATQSAK